MFNYDRHGMNQAGQLLDAQSMMRLQNQTNQAKQIMNQWSQGASLVSTIVPAQTLHLPVLPVPGQAYKPYQVPLNRISMRQCYNTANPGNSSRGFESRKRSCDYNANVSPTKRQRQSHDEERSSAIVSKITDLNSLPKPTPSDQLSSKIFAHFMKTHQTEQAFQNKLKLRESLYCIMKGVFPYCGLYMVGSSMNGFGSTNSDLDLCLMVTHKRLDQKKEATEVLFLLQRALRKCSFIREMQLIRAKVPILKFRDNIARVECDLNINNSVGIRNTYLMACYCKLDPRVRPLVMYVKTWARYHDINDARKMTLSSYSLTLMVIHYLQYSCKPAVLPCLHTLSPDTFSTTRDIRMMSLSDPLPRFEPRNTEPLADLFLGFLEYYSNKFKFEEEVISIRLGKKIPKQVVLQKECSQQWGYISIEEPFDLTNTARSVYDQYAFTRICRVIQTSFKRLKNTRDLDSLFKNPF